MAKITTEVPNFDNLEVALGLLKMTRGQIEEYIEVHLGLRFTKENDYMETSGMSTLGSTGRELSNQS